MKINRSTLLCTIAAFGLLAPAGGEAQAREPYPGLDAYVNGALRTWNVPGVAIAIVRNDSIILARGYGVREVGRPAPVTANTVFAIGSSSKAFTAAAVAMLVDERRVSLDAPAANYLPAFQLFDPYATRELSVRDLLSHRSGLARGELAWYGSDLDRDELVRRVRFLAPSWSFRSRFGYQNLMYRLQLGRGTHSGTRLVSARLMDEMHSPQTVVPLDSAAKAFNPHTHLQAYGLGWFLQDYRGRLVVQHGGNADGFTALVGLLPEERLGVVILSNMNGTPLPTALMNRIFDLHLRAPARDWSGDARSRTEAQRARAREQQRTLEAQRVPDTKSSLPLASYAGVYVDSLHGEVVIRESGGG